MSLTSLVDALKPYCEGENVFELVDGVRMGLRPAQVGEALYVMKVRSEPDQRGKGTASGAMEMLCEMADEHSVELFLEVEPFDGSGPETPVLLAWYARVGFKGDAAEMVREPRSRTNE